MANRAVRTLSGDRPAEVGFFKHVSGSLKSNPSVGVICVAHLVDSSRFFLPAIDGLLDLRLVLPKPKSADDSIRREIEKKFRCFPLTREWAGSPAAVIETLKGQGLLAPGTRLIIADIGGYFARSVSRICAAAPGQILGVMEGTENGLRKYERVQGDLPIPVFTVARSPLKYPENFLIGVAVVFSIESVLRSQIRVLQSQHACVIGFGRVGRSVATALRDHGVQTCVCDTSPIALAEAAARGFRIFRNLADGLEQATLVVGATGNVSLDARGFAALRDDTYVATVTSGDDELDLEALKNGYSKRVIGKNLERYSDGIKSFTLINGGNAVNFLHGAVVGPAIQLIEGEKLACLATISQGRGQAGINELSTDTRRDIANIWLDHFSPD